MRRVWDRMEEEGGGERIGGGEWEWDKERWSGDGMEEGGR